MKDTICSKLLPNFLFCID